MMDRKLFVRPTLFAEKIPTRDELISRIDKAIKSPPSSKVFNRLSRDCLLIIDEIWLKYPLPSNKTKESVALTGLMHGSTLSTAVTCATSATTFAPIAYTVLLGLFVAGFEEEVSKINSALLFLQTESTQEFDFRCKIVCLLKESVTNPSSKPVDWESISVEGIRVAYRALKEGKPFHFKRVKPEINDKTLSESGRQDNASEAKGEDLDSIFRTNSFGEIYSPSESKYPRSNGLNG